MGEDRTLTHSPLVPRVALVGDYQPAVLAHQGIDRSMLLAASHVPSLEWEWVPTASLEGDIAERLARFTGIWLVPASPYASESGALRAVTHARSRGVPFLGTCGGFQHALLEFARNALGVVQAGHAETQPEAVIPLVAPLSCSLVEQHGTVHLLPGSRVREILGVDRVEEGYHCSYGLNPAYESLLTGGGSALRVSARDGAGEVRAVELLGHPFFIATLFQPERRALAGTLHPLIHAFIEAQLSLVPLPS